MKRRCPSADGHSAALPQQDKEREVLKIIAATILLALSIVQAQAEEQTRFYGPNGKSLGTPSSPRRWSSSALRKKKYAPRGGVLLGNGASFPVRTHCIPHQNGHVLRGLVLGSFETSAPCRAKTHAGGA